MKHTLPFAVVLLTCTTGWAQTPATNPRQVGVDLKELSLEALGNIEVTSVTKEAEPLQRTPAAITVITHEDIRRSGATSIAEVLRLAPGLTVARIDSDHWSIGVRGFGDQFSKSVLVMIDGRSVYTPLFAGVFWAMQDVALDDIERIEVIRGPGGTIWGANAVNGVINVITKDARDTPGTQASFGTGNVDRGIGSVRYGGGNGKDLDYRVYAKGFNRGSQAHSDQTDFDTWWMGEMGFRSDWSRGRDHLVVEGGAYKGSDGQSVSLATFSPPAQVMHYESMDMSGGHVLADWQRRLSSGDSVKVQAYYDRTNLLGPQIGESRDTFDIDFISRFNRLRRQRITWGAGARYSPDRITQTIPTLDITPHSQSDHVYSAFLQDESTLVDNRLWVTLGAKLEHNNYTGTELQPSARVMWTPTVRQSVWASVSRAVRTPSRLEEDFQLTGFLAPKPPTFLRISGNPQFQSETLLGYEAGYRSVITPSLYIDVAAFRNHLNSLESFGAPSLVTEATPAPAHLLYVFPYANGVEGWSEGFEIAPDWKPIGWWQVKGSYSYLHMNLGNSPGNADTSAVKTYEGASPSHQVQVQSLIDFPRGWQMDAAFRHVSALPVKAVEAYGAFDLRLGWRASNRLELSVAGQNLTSARHVEFAHDPPPSVAMVRSVYASATWRR